ncbi:MAG: PrgI family protein [bacterium]
MRFQIPQFIERESKIAGPLSFKQFIFIVVAGVIVVGLWVVFADKNFFLFLLSSIIVLGATAALAFMKVDGRTLPSFLYNAIFFSFSNKLYLWEKKETIPTVLTPKKIIKEITSKEETPLIVSEKSQLQKLSKEIETGMK